MPHCTLLPPNEFNVTLSRSHVQHYRVKEFHPPYWKSFFTVFYFLFFWCSLGFGERQLSYRLRYTCLLVIRPITILNLFSVKFKCAVRKTHKMLLITALLPVDASSTIVHGPQNRTSFSRSTVNFRCTSDQTSDQPTDIYWKYKAVRDDSNRYIFDHDGRNEKLFDDRFVKAFNGSTGVLTIRNIQKSDEGTYSCRESYSSSVRSAQLTVIG